jgi:hypothetical protein
MKSDSELEQNKTNSPPGHISTRLPTCKLSVTSSERGAEGRLDGCSLGSGHGKVSSRKHLMLAACGVLLDGKYVTVAQSRR